jgi:S1-C subfamily serine protease
VRAESGDIITHVNGHAVNSVEELLCAVSTAKDKMDVQIAVRDTNSGDLVVLYVTSTKKK